MSIDYELTNNEEFNDIRKDFAMVKSNKIKLSKIRF